MRFIADLHIHSRYSIATSRDLGLESLWRWGQLKGIRVIGTGDCTHPLWLEELERELIPDGNGLFRLRETHDLCGDPDVPERCLAPVSFLPSGEISCIYRKNDRTRKVHCLVLLPNLDAVRRLNERLARIGSITSDGRPILKLDAKDLLAMLLEASPEALLIPAHAWTPHFSVFGVFSGFNTLEECFEELAPHVFAIETGLSSDPAMNWRISALDGITLVSNSDAHSASKLGREATIFDTDPSYQGIYRAISSGEGLAGTIEFFPEQGKYHADGHRCCGVRLAPSETVANGYRCPACGGKVTVGVLHRLELVADRPSGTRPAGAPPFCSVIPLIDLIAATLRVGSGSKKAQKLYFELLGRLGNEFHVLLEAPLEEIAVSAAPLAVAIGRMRRGEVEIDPGYDGRFGTVSVTPEP
ncbi:MAG: DNA helicase UvrD [Geobacter sp.]|nr:MAG: DNA helicase UvrD [Geobacter sp.]